MHGKETHFFPNRKIKHSLGRNDRMTFWGLEGKHIPFITKSKIFQYQEGLFSLSWILPAHTSSFPHPTSPFITLNKDEN